jgi:hypothetical protein
MLITNDRQSRVKPLVERYASRMNIEQRPAEFIRAFHIDALASAVPLNVLRRGALGTSRCCLCLLPAPPPRPRIRDP